MTFIRKLPKDLRRFRRLRLCLYDAMDPLWMRDMLQDLLNRAEYGKFLPPDFETQTGVPCAPVTSTLEDTGEDDDPTGESVVQRLPLHKWRLHDGCATDQHQQASELVGVSSSSTARPTAQTRRTRTSSIHTNESEAPWLAYGPVPPFHEFQYTIHDVKMHAPQSVGLLRSFGFRRTLRSPAFEAPVACFKRFWSDSVEDKLRCLQAFNNAAANSAEQMRHEQDDVDIDHDHNLPLDPSEMGNNSPHPHYAE